MVSFLHGKIFHPNNILITTLMHTLTLLFPIVFLNIYAFPPFQLNL
jgi:high-affinity K+ transport system ATPase subunit B